MLGMIEINLLPSEYRVQERTPLGLFLTIVVGICAVGGIGVYELNLRNDLQRLKQRNDDLTKEAAAKKIEKEKVDKLRAEIATAEKRQNTIIEISQSKIVWSQKLIQFSKIMQDYPDFWIDRLNLQKAGAGSGTLTLNFYAVGNDLKKVAGFEERIKNDTNFWYHFERFNAPRVSVPPVTSGGGPLSKYGYSGPIMYFDVSMPVK
jgi:Tfp pilus assembly protein PilN